MQVNPNQFKRGLREGRPLIGFWCSLGSPAAVEILGDAGLDWLLIDTEHAPNEPPGVAEQLRALTTSTASPVVRPAWNDAVLIKRILDLGAQTVLVPYVETAQEAHRAVAATRYPPHGNRGVASVHRANRYGRVTDYFARSNDEMCVVAQLETSGALENLEAIVAVDGVDAVFVGPSDLSASLGYIGQVAHPAVRGEIEAACKRARAVGKPIGILAPVEEHALAYLEMGFNFVAVGSDIVTLRKGSDALVEKFRRAIAAAGADR